MIDIKVFRENPKLIKESNKKRGLETKDVDLVIKTDEEYRKLQTEVQQLKQKRNLVTEDISRLKKDGKSAAKQIKEMGKVSQEIKDSDEKINKLFEERENLRKKIPNILDSEVPQGKDSSDNKELRNWGTLPKFDFALKGHADLVEELGIADMKRAAKVSGARFYYLKNELVLLNLALQKFALDFLIKKGFEPVQTPYMLNRAALGGAVSLKDFEESIYKIDNDDLYLIGTSEHALAAMHQDEVVDVREPIKYAGISSCFRKEAGSHGKDTKGIFRVHTFEKIEQFSLCKPEDEKKVFDEFIHNQEEIFKLLKLPYHVIALCSGDMGGSMAKTHDLEAWFPEQKTYRELGSTSTAKNYQSNKLNIKYINDKNEREHVYTLNGTAMSVQRTICCILENYQQKDGSVKIPDVLVPYMDGIKEIKSVKK
jgi:seryl-tRNA synthetase